VNVASIIISDFAQEDKGKLHLIGAFDRVLVDSPPAVLGQMSLSLIIHGHAAEAGSTHSLQIQLLNQRREMMGPPIDATFMMPPSELVVPGIPLRVVLVLTILSPAFPEFGAYAFEVYIDGTYHAGASLYVGPSATPADLEA
jgi:hypothetical protein